VDYWTKPVSVEIARIRARNHLDLKKSRDLLAKMAMTDELSRLANRRGFDECLAREWRRALRAKRPVSLIMADIDCFKDFNDSFGHPAGDVCLRQVAAVLEGALARSADLAARYGGEEFACILPETELDGATAIARAVRFAVMELEISHPTSPAGIVTLSLGVACAVPEDAAGLALLIDRADKALYAAKRAGRNRVEVG
jgi:diguanylate cyclase (GGDEF)-like protein